MQSDQALYCLLAKTMIMENFKFFFLRYSAGKEIYLNNKCFENFIYSYLYFTKWQTSQLTIGHINESFFPLQ
jgi:hypothetical protein